MGSSVVRDYSGLAAQGRPISAQSYSQKRQMSKVVNSLFGSSGGTGSALGNHGNCYHGYPQEAPPPPPLTRPRSVLSGCGAERGRSGGGGEGGGGGGGGGRGRESERECSSREGWSKERCQSGKFVASFYESVLSSRSSSSSCSNKGRREGSEEAVPGEVGEEGGGETKSSVDDRVSAKSKW